MLALAERFQSGRLSASDAQRIIGAGLRGAGYELHDEAVGRMQTEGGAAGFVDIVARLLGATFGSPAAPVVGAVVGEIVSGIADAAISGLTEIKNAPAEKRAPPVFPSLSGRRRVFDTTREGVRGGGRSRGEGRSSGDPARSSGPENTPSGKDAAPREGRARPDPFPGPT